MSKYRPQRATGKPDANHWMVRDFLRDVCGGFEPHQEGDKTVYTAYLQGCRVYAVDTHTIGGLFLDWIVGCGSVSCWVEIKTPEAYAAKDHSIRPGEAWTLENLKNGVIVSTDIQVSDLFSDLVDDYILTC